MRHQEPPDSYCNCCCKQQIEKEMAAVVAVVERTADIVPSKDQGDHTEQKEQEEVGDKTVAEEHCYLPPLSLNKLIWLPTCELKRELCEAKLLVWKSRENP